MANSFVIAIPNLGLPIPGGSTSGKTNYVAFPYDAWFNPPAPLPNTNDFKDILIQSGWTFFQPSMKFDFVDLGLRPSRVIDPQQSNWLNNIAGSARPGKKLAGKQYWEVEIVQVPTASVPDNVIIGASQYEGPPNGAQAWETTGENAQAYAYPPMTDPANAPNPTRLLGAGQPIAFYPSAPIGGHAILSSPVWTYNALANGYDSNGNFQQTLTLTFSWPPSLNTFFNPTIGLWPIDPTFNQYSSIGLDSPLAQVRSIGVTRTSVMHGKLTFQIDDTDALYGGYDGRDVGNVAVPQWPPADPIDHLYGDLFRAPDIDTGSQLPIVRNEFGPWDGSDNGDCAFAGDGGVMLPFGVPVPATGQVKYGAPVFKGRADRLASIQQVGVDNGVKDISNGVWTGVDLGGFVQGDIIMLATDVDSRKVWFGKNGVWYAPIGSDYNADPQNGVGWAAMMDGDPTVPGGPPAPKNYYPGVSMRLGPTSVKMLFSGATFHYAPPAGFSPYAAIF